MGASNLPLAWIEWSLDWGPLAKLAVFAVAAGVLALSWSNLRGAQRPWQRATLLGLRGTLLGVLLVIFLQPTWIQERIHRGGRVVAIVLDASSSMALGAVDHQRWDRARAIAKQLSKHNAVRIFTAGQRLQTTSLSRLKSAQANERGTDLLAALEELSDLRRPAGLGAVVLISDGLDNGRLQALVDHPSSKLLPDEETAAVLTKLGVPVHSVFVEDLEPLRDLVVTAIHSSPYGFVRNRLPVTVEVELHGYETRGEQIEIVLRDNGRPVTSTQIPLAGPLRRALPMEIQPQRTGAHVLSASIAPLPDEITTVNNDAHVLLHVVRDRLRVMHLAGHPSWDTRYLRAHLRGDRSVDLVSFYVMVGQGAHLYVQAQDTTLIPFPTRELFEDALSDFDLVIFHDFQFGAFGVERYLPLLHTWVRRGGGLLIIGGQQSLSAGGYGQTALASWLPLQVGLPMGRDTGYRNELFKPHLTAAGQTHPLTRLLDSSANNAALWSSVTLQGYNTSLSPRQDASVLLQSSDEEPLLAASDSEQGRVAVMGSDGLWRWAFPPPAVQDRAALRASYHQFIDRLSGWLTHDPTWDALHLSAPTEPLDRGERATLTARVTLPNGRPAEGVSLRWRVQALPTPKDERRWKPLPGKTDAQGLLRWRWSSRAPGPYRLQISATLSGQRQLATTVLSVRQTDAEGRRIRPDPEILKTLARASGGQLYHSPPKTPLPMLSRKRAPKLSEKTRTELWTGPWVLLLLVMMLTLEWVLRRRWGLA